MRTLHLLNEKIFLLSLPRRYHEDENTGRLEVNEVMPRLPRRTAVHPRVKASFIWPRGEPRGQSTR